MLNVFPGMIPHEICDFICEHLVRVLHLIYSYDENTLMEVFRFY